LLEEKVVKKLLLVIFALSLFASTIYVESNLSKANAAANPQETMENYQLYNDGVGSTPSISWDGAKFTLTEDLEGTITLMNDGIVLDGAGFTVKVDGDSNGIVAYDKNAVTIKNVNVQNSYTGILLGHYSPDAFLWYDPNPNRPTNCTICNCHISNCTTGILISGGVKCIIRDNQVRDSENGITFFGIENVFRNNQLANNKVNFQDITYEKSDVDSSNTINGKPIYYIVNKQNLTVPTDAGMVHLEGCSNIVVRNLDLKNAYYAILLFNSSNCKLYGNTLTDNEIGISLRNSTNNSIIGNNLLNNSDDAIEQYDSENTTITNNLIKANGGGIDSSGYTAVGSRNVVISSNQIIANNGGGIQAGPESTIKGNYIERNGQNGIYFWDISNSIITQNNITQNGEYGISFRNGKNASISGNDISKNKGGIELGEVMGEISECSITENNFAQNANLAIRIDGDFKGNRFYLNNFIGNNNGSVQVLIKPGIVWEDDEGYNPNFPQWTTRYNVWDNGSAGNFWSDNNSTSSSAVYKIADRNVDQHPLDSPICISTLELPSTGVPQEIIGIINSAGFQTILIFVVAFPIASACGLLLYWKKRRR
jgi:parallel beta-helix repeat protein